MGAFISIGSFISRRAFIGQHGSTHSIEGVGDPLHDELIHRLSGNTVATGE